MGYRLTFEMVHRNKKKTSIILSKKAKQKKSCISPCDSAMPLCVKIKMYAGFPFLIYSEFTVEGIKLK